MGGCVCVHMYLSRYLGMGAFVEYRCCFCDIIITCLSAGFGCLEENCSGLAWLNGCVST